MTPSVIESGFIMFNETQVVLMWDKIVLRIHDIW
jgi:hypothetical protein